SVMLWGALGIETVFADDAREIERSVNRLAREGAAVIYITEQAMIKIPDTVEKFKTQPFPAIIPIPNAEGNLGIGMRGISENIEKAIGADILFEEEGNN
ncbi:MAG: V-type ATP synthase subunit F, partial [Oscillospiraceae bacterium]